MEQTKQKDQDKETIYNFFREVCAIHQPPCLLLVEVTEKGLFKLKAAASNSYDMSVVLDPKNKNDYIQ